jgi:hypothetical protein
MNEYAADLLQRFGPKGALVDANLLLLLLVGSYDRGLVGVNGFKRVAQYTLDDFAALILLLKQFRIPVTTPHVLTEVSNLAGQLPNHRKAGCFKKFVELFQTFTEIHGASLSSATRAEFPYLGLTDCVIADAASDYLVITDDLPLYNALIKSGLDALNFNHIRTLAWNV